MNCETIPLPFQNPALVQVIVTGLQAHFQTNLSWLQTCYGLVKTGIVIKDKQRFRYPQIYLNDSSIKHKDIRPNSTAKSFCFFELNSEVAHETEDLATQAGTLTYDLGIVFWLNLPKIDNRTYDFTQQLIADVLQGGLFSSPYRYEAKDITVDSRPESVFEKYSLDPTEKQFLMYPYSGFRVDCKIVQEYLPGCYVPFAAQGDTSVCATADSINYENVGYVNPDYNAPG